MKKIIVIAVLIVAVIGAVLWYFLRDRDAVQIRQTIDRLYEMVGRRPGEAPAAEALKWARPDRVFADTVIVRSDRPEIDRKYTARELGTLIAGARKNCQRLTLEATVPEIVIDGPRATADCEAELSGASSARKEEFAEYRHVEFHLEKKEGKWRISAVISTLPLQK